MNNFAAVAEHFRKLQCTHCRQSFTPEGLELLREEREYWVVRVTCQACQQPSGVAVVGIETTVPQARPARRAPRAVDAVYASRRERDAFASKPAIDANDVLDASRFIRAMGADWARHLPRT